MNSFLCVVIIILILFVVIVRKHDYCSPDLNRHAGSFLEGHSFSKENGRPIHRFLVFYSDLAILLEVDLRMFDAVGQIVKGNVRLFCPAYSEFGLLVGGFHNVNPSFVELSLVELLEYNEVCSLFWLIVVCQTELFISFLESEWVVLLAGIATEGFPVER